MIRPDPAGSELSGFAAYIVRYSGELVIAYSSLPISDDTGINKFSARQWAGDPPARRRSPLLSKSRGEFRDGQGNTAGRAGVSAVAGRGSRFNLFITSAIHGVK
jgi:hypothetical protein